MFSVANILSMTKRNEISSHGLQQLIRNGLAQSDVINPSVAIAEIRDKKWPKQVIGSALHVSGEMDGEEVSFQFKCYHKRGTTDVRRSVNISSERIVAMVPDEVHAGANDTIYNGNIDFLIHPDDKQRRVLAEALHVKTSKILADICSGLDTPSEDPFSASGNANADDPFAIKRDVVKQMAQDIEFRP